MCSVRERPVHEDQIESCVVSRGRAALPPDPPGATQGGVKGRVVVNLQGLEGIPLTLVNVVTGHSFAVRTAKDGSYSISLPSGSYVVSSPGIRGLSIGRAPLLIQVTSGPVRFRQRRDGESARPARRERNRDLSQPDRMRRT